MIHYMNIYIYIRYVICEKRPVDFSEEVSPIGLTRLQAGGVCFGTEELPEMEINNS